MWKGKVTDELKKLAREYVNQFHGIGPDGYEGVYYDEMGYEEFVRYIKEALKQGVELPYVLPAFEIPNPHPKVIVETTDGEILKGRMIELFQSEECVGLEEDSVSLELEDGRTISLHLSKVKSVCEY